MIRVVRMNLMAGFVACLTGCADTSRAVGGLQLGVQDAPLRPPSRIDDGQPFQFPTQAWQEGVGGTAVLKLLISRQGTVDSVMVVESSGHASLDSAALAQASGLRFVPATQGGDPVQVWGRLPVIFPRSDGTEPDADSP
ncbi:MAG: energy transducer TonB [Gemmatimonadota bacterium]|nr:energy transducer TonB [Gemmatimonadota bacterium]MDH3426924.1 energy transducer TonB [Gemmatimonadota bacterium]